MRGNAKPGITEVFVFTSLRRHYPDQVLRVCSQPTINIESTPGNAVIFHLYFLKIKNRNEDKEVFL